MNLELQIQRLKELGFAVFIFDEAAIRTVFADPNVDIHAAIYQLVQLAAILGKTQFVKLMRTTASSLSLRRGSIPLQPASRAALVSN